MDNKLSRLRRNYLADPSNRLAFEQFKTEAIRIGGVIPNELEETILNSLPDEAWLAWINQKVWREDLEDKMDNTDLCYPWEDEDGWSLIYRLTSYEIVMNKDKPVIYFNIWNFERDFDADEADLANDIAITDLNRFNLFDLMDSRFMENQWLQYYYWCEEHGADPLRNFSLYLNTKASMTIPFRLVQDGDRVIIAGIGDNYVPPETVIIPQEFRDYIGIFIENDGAYVSDIIERLSEIKEDENLKIMRKVSNILDVDVTLERSVSPSRQAILEKARELANKQVRIVADLDERIAFLEARIAENH